MVQDKVACAYCRNVYSPFNVKKHEVGCAMNPENGGKPTSPLTTPATTPATTPEEDFEEPNNEQGVKIRNVIFMPGCEMVACFNTAEGTTAIPINFLGTVIIGKDEIASMLIVDPYGQLKPPTTFDGFVGVFRSDQLESSSQEDVFAEDSEPEIIPEPEKTAMTQENSIDEMIARVKEMKS